MEIKILDSIMHGVLKPWKLDTTNTRRFTELVKAAKAASPDTNATLLSQLTALLVDFPSLQKIINEEAIGNAPLQPLSWKSDLPKYKDAVTHFYYFVITGETLRIYNAVLQQAANWTELVDIRHHLGKFQCSFSTGCRSNGEGKYIRENFVTCIHAFYTGQTSAENSQCTCEKNIPFSIIRKSQCTMLQQFWHL
jgi:hypothetical protein